MVADTARAAMWLRASRGRMVADSAGATELRAHPKGRMAVAPSLGGEAPRGLMGAAWEAGECKANTAAVVFSSCL
jgi:hypothetical protein